MDLPGLVLTRFDRSRLLALLDATGDRDDLEALRDEIERAEVVEPEDMPGDRVTMNSRIRFRNETTGEESEIVLVFPAEADADRNRVSVFAPVGSAVLGLSVGDSIEWPLPGGRTTQLTVSGIVYQPEAAGDPI